MHTQQEINGAVCLYVNSSVYIRNFRLVRFRLLGFPFNLYIRGEILDCFLVSCKEQDQERREKFVSIILLSVAMLFDSVQKMRCSMIFSVVVIINL